MSYPLSADVRKQCSQQIARLQKLCTNMNILRPSNTCEDARPKEECAALVAKRQCDDEYRAKMCCKSCVQVNSGASFDVTVLPNITSTHGAPVFTNLFFNSLLTAVRANTWLTEKEFVQHPESTTDLPVPKELRVSSWPFERGIAITNLTNSSFSFLLAIVISIALAFVPPTFALFIVREKEFKQRHQQSVSGLSPVVYWLSNFAYDFSMLMIILLLTLVTFAIAQVSRGTRGWSWNRRDLAACVIIV